MSYLRGSLNPVFAIVDVLVGISRARKLLLKKNSIPNPEPVHVRALLDTGASISGFPPRVFKQLGITPVSKTEVLTPSTPTHQPHVCDLYDVSLSLVVNGSARPFPDTRVMVADCWMDGEGVEALIGMDILGHCHFQLFGPEKEFVLALPN